MCLQSAYSEKLYSEIEIPVYVAEKLSDTCGDTYKGGILWPRTKKVIKENLLCTQGRIFQPSPRMHSDLKLRTHFGNCTSYAKLLKNVPK